MGQKVHPIGFRLGIYRGWDARWFAQGKKYGKFLIEDMKIRKYLKGVLEKAEISRVEIEKAADSIRIIIYSGRPGHVIGKKGQEIEVLRNQLSTLLKKQNIEISVQEVDKPELDAVLIAQNIATQLEQRVSYKGYEACCTNGNAWWTQKVLKFVVLADCKGQKLLVENGHVLVLCLFIRCELI